ncbi:hypothetical protein D3C76_1878380 [compost metagenome]
MVVGQRVFRGGDEVQGVVPDRDRLDQVMGLWSQGNDGNFGAAMENLVVGRL